MGDSSSDINSSDTGVATYVGGDMFIGKRSNNLANNNGATGGGPDGSYAAEAEGATIVNGNLYSKLKKGFFNMGMVAFGSQFVPEQGTQVLTVGGNSNSTIPSGHAYAWKDPEAPTPDKDKGRSVVGLTDNYKINNETGAESNYTASIAGSESQLYGYDGQTIFSAVTPYSGTKDHVKWNQSDTLKSIHGLKNDAGDNVDSSDFSNYGQYLKDLSAQMKSYKGTDEMKVTVAENDLTTDDVNNPGSNYVRYKYNYGKGKETSYKFTFANNSLKEKLLVFHGDGKSALQVFNVDSSMLATTSDQTGISYKFENIPENTSIVINVTGSNKNIDFHNGWRFLWTDTDGNTVDLSNGYWDPSYINSTDQKQKTAFETYAERASKILWNFADADNVTIRGGKASGNVEVKNYVNHNNAWNNADGITTDDDPAAAMMGSILVPTGNFESHVSTNGRVWVGGDFSMYNPSNTKNGEGKAFINDGGQKTASVIDMDQERHNLPWSGNYTSQCAALEWTKVDAADTSKKLAGSSWAIYATENDAKNGTNPLKLVTDNEPIVDLNGADGIIKVGGLNTNATYYVKEIGAPQDYEPSDTIYMVKSGKEGTTVTVEYGTDAKFNTDGTVSNNASKVAPDGKIGNDKKGTSLTWKKTKEDGTSLLAGSSWTLTKKGENGGADQSWTVKDNTVRANGVSIYRTSDTANPITELTMNMTETVNLTTKVTPSTAVQKVYWSSQTENYKNILRIDLNDDGTSTAYTIGPGTVKATVCTVSEKNGNGNKVEPVCADLTVTVSANVPDVSTFSVKHGNTELPNGSSIDLIKDSTAQLTVTATTADGAAVTPTYASSNTSVATIDENGKITAVAAGTASITVTAGTQSRAIIVNVTNEAPVQYTYIYFPSSGEGAWGADIMRVHYGTGSNWQDSENMTVATCDGNWKVARIPRVTASNVEFGFKRNGDDKAWYGKNGGGNFTFPANAEAVTVSGGNMTAGYPSNSSCSPVKPMSLDLDEADVADGQSADVADEASLTDAAESAESGETAADDADTTDRSADTADDAADAAAGQSDAAAGAEDAVADAIADEEQSGETVEHKTRAVVDAQAVADTLDDVDSDAGEFKVIDLDPGTYWLTESGAPDGYTVNANVYKITIDKDEKGALQVNWEGGWPSLEKANANQDFNKNLKPGDGNAISDKPTEITWYKVSSEDKNPTADTYLKGAQWKLTFTPPTGSTGTNTTVYCVVDGKGDIAQSDSKPTCTGEKLSDVSKTDQSGNVQNEADGIIKLTGLKFGSYELVETVAPAGYDLSSVTYKFTIGSTAGTVQIHRPVTSTSAVQSDADVSGNVSLSDFGIVPLSSEQEEDVEGNKIPNNPGVELPATGGEGTSVFLHSGLIAVLVATFGLALMARRRRS
ncbi:SpaA isopeptide-forming pilin-related protein [Bifidobacterium biavatii]|nr:SpaA isopeptide-forming pilin-related protein [Bifidobacterium biavatii]